MAAHRALSLVQAGCYEEAENVCLVALRANPDSAQLFVAHSAPIRVVVVIVWYLDVFITFLLSATVIFTNITFQTLHLCPRAWSPAALRGC